jgi:hypothetical protein
MMVDSDRRRDIDDPSKLARYSLSRGWPPIVLYCARRTRPFSVRAFREHRTNVGVLPLPPSLIAFSSREGVLLDLPLCVLNESLPTSYTFLKRSGRGCPLLRTSSDPHPSKGSFQARLFYSLKDSRDCCCGHQSPVDALP